MYLFPNGQNIQFLPPPQLPPGAHGSSGHVHGVVGGGGNAPSTTPEKGVLQALKEIAPGLNRKARRAKLVEIKTKAKSETKVLVEKEIAKQKKEKARG